jgi:hypothetical protein
MTQSLVVENFMRVIRTHISARKVHLKNVALFLQRAKI